MSAFAAYGPVRDRGAVIVATSANRARALTAFAAVVPLVAGLLAATSAAAGTATAPAARLVRDPAAYVDPLIGTEDGVHDFPGADVPFGMVQWSPDTPTRPGGGGYAYTDRRVTGFSLTHLSGPGCGVAGDVPVLPVSGAIPAAPGTASLPLDHRTEVARAGYYRLSSGGITTGLTTAPRTGMAIVDFPRGRPGDLLLKLSGSQTGTDATSVRVVSNREIAGSVTSGDFCRAANRYTLHFDMVFDRPFFAHGTWTNHDSTAAHATQAADRSSTGVRRASPVFHGPKPASRTGRATRATGPGGLYLRFRTASDAAVRAKVGLSYVGARGAVVNRRQEIPGWDFAAVRAAANNEWNRALGRIRIGGGTVAERTVFYTALYHALLHPNTFSDVDGRYRGFDGDVHRAPRGSAEYTDDSGWDIYRTQAQLEAMIAPRRASETARSMLDQYTQTGQLPKWELYNSESYMMVGDPDDSILADYYAFGARGFAVRSALAAMVAQADRANPVRPGLHYYLRRGYQPSGAHYGCCNFYGPVSTQQEYAIADNSIAKLARALHRPAIAHRFSARANRWQNMFDPATGYLERKADDGRFLPGFTPNASTGFVEGDSNRYTPLVPQDLSGLITAAGGASDWVGRLNGLLRNLTHPSPRNADVGNEPSIEIPWEYDYARAPWRTQRAVRDIEQRIFLPQPAGMAGNDDLGTLSSWYVWAALGLYPETPGSADMVLGSPLFPRAVVTLPNGRTLNIVGTGAATNAPYVHRVSLDGATYRHDWVAGSLVRNGGTLHFTLSRTPDRSWAAAPADAPPSNTRGLAPALGYASAPRVATTPGHTVPVTLGVRSLRSTAQTIDWTAVTGAHGPAVSPPSGTLNVGPDGTASQTVTLTAPASRGRFPVTFRLTGAGGTSLPDVVVRLVSAPAGRLSAYADNAGRSSDGTSNEGDFDGDGWSYSAQQLAADGWTPGASKKVGGLIYTFPDADAGGLDDVVAAGQTLPLANTAGDDRLGILGSATNARNGASGTFTVGYSDGTTSTLQLGLSDWTLAGGSVQPRHGDVVAATAPYRDEITGARQHTPTYLFAVSGPTTAGKTITSVTLPATVSHGRLHVFAVSTG